MLAASAASPNITGQIGCSPGRTSKPSSCHPVRNSAVLRRSCSRCSPLPATRSSAASDPATTLGATALENRYGRDRCRSSSTISARALTYPPDAPPSALPSVPVTMSTRSWHAEQLRRAARRSGRRTPPRGSRRPSPARRSCSASVADLVQRRQVAVHGEHAVGDDQAAAARRRPPSAASPGRPCRGCGSGSAAPCRAGCRR